MISYKEFEVIRTLLRANKPIEKIPDFVWTHVQHHAFKSETESSLLVSQLQSRGFIYFGSVTQKALTEIEPLRVNNAIILAAGGDDVSVKSVYSMPKGLFIKDGETLIERQIRQLRDVGIKDITVVVGHKQELYFFLQDKWGVTLEINPDCKKNNIYSLYVARKHLSSTYVLNCDNYFSENPFSLYEYDAFHATVKKTDSHNELVIRKNSSGRILEVGSCEDCGECIYGHAYFNREFSRRFLSYMEDEIADFRISALFWEEFVSRHAEDLDMYAHEYDESFVKEFDRIQEIQSIGGLFLTGVDAVINNRICEALNCKENDISNIVILEKGLTNILFTFDVRGERFIFRFPGESSRFFIYRKNECMAQKIAAKAHADDTYVYIDETGVKISKYRQNCKDIHGIYYEDVDFMCNIARKIRAFHDEGYRTVGMEAYDYDPLKECERLFNEASKTKGNLHSIFSEQWRQMQRLKHYADCDGIPRTMCHNDINIDNVLWTGTTLDIIDWEFAGFNDPAYDFGRVIAGLEYAVDDPRIDIILEAYFNRPPTELEHLHWIAYAAIHNWYYVGWALYKESINESSRDWMLFFYTQAKRLSAWCLPKYEAIYGKDKQ